MMQISPELLEKVVAEVLAEVMAGKGLASSGGVTLPECKGVKLQEVGNAARIQKKSCLPSLRRLQPVLQKP